MKIVIFTTEFYPLTGGVATYLDLLTKELSKDNEIIVYTMSQDEDGHEFMHNKVQVKQFPKIFKLFSYYSNKKMIEKIGEDRPDILFANHYGYYPSIACMKASKRYKIPYIFGTYYHPPIYGWAKSVLFWGYYCVFGRRTIRNASCIVACSEIERCMMLELGARKVEIVPLIVDDCYNTENRNDDGKTILYCGALTWWKGFDEFMKIVDQLPKSVNVIVKTNSKDNISIPLDRNFKLINESYTKEQLCELYKSVTVMVSPSYYESFGITIAECLACGTPVVSTKQGAIPEVVEDGNLGLLSDYGDTKTMRENITKIINKKVVFNNQRISEIVRKKYSAEKVGREITKVLKDANRDLSK